MLELLLFGTIEIRRGGEAIHGLSAKGKLLLAYLALRSGRAVASAQIAEAVFGESQAGDPHDLVKKAASEIRRFLGEEGPRLSSPAPRTLALDLEGVAVDWAAFRSATQRNDSEALQHAVALHTRPFLEREPLYWTLEEQANCLRLRQQALETLARQATADGDLESAGAWFAQMLKFELPDVTLNEAIWREFLETLLQRQEFGKVQLHYGRLQTFLGRTAGRAPEASTAALYQRIPKSILLRMSQAGPRRPKRLLPDSVRLPYFPFALLGREGAQQELLGIFKNSRLVTVVGIGGVGKTRFAVQVGLEIMADYQDEVGFFDLSACAPNTVLSTLTTAFGIQESLARSPYASLRELLTPHRLLLILDNCEHLIEEVAALVSDLVRDCPHLRLLSTSRESLRVDGEQIFVLAPLALSSEGQGRSSRHASDLSLSTIRESPAIRLFLERAAAVRPGFQMTAENGETIKTLCRLVDGLPLGIEMVASQMAGVPLERIAGDLAQSALSLRNTRRGVSPRHQTLQAALDWSFGMLSEAEQTLLRRLSVFTGGWTLEAAESICADAILPRAEIPFLLSELVTKSLVVMERTDARLLPFRFLETIRGYAILRLTASQETTAMQAAHSAAYLEMLTQIDAQVEIKTYLLAVDRDRGNLFSALQRCLETPDLLQQGHRLALCLHTYWTHRGLRTEGRTWHRRFLEAGRERLSSTAQASSLLKIFDYSSGLGEGDSVEARQCLQEALAIYRAEGDRKGESDVYLTLGSQQAYTYEYAETYANFQKAFDYYRDAGPPHTRIYLLIMLGGCESNLQLHAEAEASHRQALDLARTSHSPSMEGLALLFRAFSARNRDLFALAERHFLQSLEVYESIPSAWGTVRAQCGLADIKRRQGAFDRSQEIFRDCLTTACTFADSQEIVFILHAVSQLLHDRQDWEASLGLSAGLQHLSALFPDPVDKFQTEMENARATATAHLGPQTSEAILLEACTATLDSLVDYTLAILAPSEPPLPAEHTE